MISVKDKICKQIRIDIRLRLHDEVFFNQLVIQLFEQIKTQIYAEICDQVQVQIFSNVRDQEIYKVSLSNGMELDCSPGHKWLIQKGNPKHPERCLCKEVETTDLKIGDIIEKYSVPFVEFSDPDEFLNPYIHGFFCGDGSYCNNYPTIYLYDKKRELLPYFKYDSLQKSENPIRFYVTKYINK